jgi:thiol-disulfide isomerase/thioredoxin
VAETIAHDRRHFLGSAAMMFAAAHFGMFDSAEAGVPSELAAIGRAAEWINSAPLTPADLSGKVVLVDFWTYTCINWLRTMPYLRAWKRKYQHGLVLIGVHTPEFGFEQNVDNVRRAVRQMEIDYPIAIDNDYGIWRAFGNQYWPALYFVDGKGRVRQHYFGESGYDQAEGALQRLLADSGDAGAEEGAAPIVVRPAERSADWTNLKSQETYVGYQRSERFASPGGADRDQRRRYAVPEHLSLNQWALAGEWAIGGQATILRGATGRIAYRFHARDLHLVMGPPRSGASIRFRVSIDGQPPGLAHGLDVDEGGNGIVAEPRMHQLIRQPGPIVDRLFQIEFLDTGVESYSFTFG